MQKTIKIILFCCLSFGMMNAFAQDLRTNINANKSQQDSIRKKLDTEKDSIVYTSKFIRYTTLKLIKDSTQTLPIDTGLAGLQNFSVLQQPRRPTVGTGVLGLAAKSLLFEPSKTIGFDAGFHSFDFYVLNNEDVKFYRARSPFSSLYYVNGSEKEQVLKLLHTQNIKKNWNFGGNYNRIGANGFYSHQRGDHLNAALFTWYESTNKRYNLWFNGVFNTMKAQENGSIVKNDIFEDTNQELVDKLAETVKLTTAKQLWRKSSFLLKQSYFVGRIDSTGKNNSQNILPTNKITHTLTYSNTQYSFKKDETDSYNVFPQFANPDDLRNPIDAIFTNDSTNVKHLQNEFIYSFFLRAKGNSIIKNELKVDAGIRHDFYQYAQYGMLRDLTKFYAYTVGFQNITLLGSAGYRFSNRIDLNLDLQQIFQGRNTGDFLYEAKSNILLSKKAGRIVLGAYVQNKSPEEIYNKYYGNHFRWDNRGNLDRTKIANLSFNYNNEALKFDASANYYLITDYLYFIQDGASGIIPAQQSGDMNMLKLSVGKQFNFGSYHLDTYVVYQKTDNQNVLRTPEVYTFNSIYKDVTLFKVLKTQIGFDVRYNTPFVAAGYSPAVSQFYNETNPQTLGSKPIADVWIKASLRRANLFLKYDYVNQGLFSKGFYTVDRYPMPDRLLKFGLTWNFYD